MGTHECSMLCPTQWAGKEQNGKVGGSVLSVGDLLILEHLSKVHTFPSCSSSTAHPPVQWNKMIQTLNCVFVIHNNLKLTGRIPKQEELSRVYNNSFEGGESNSKKGNKNKITPNTFIEFSCSFSCIDATPFCRESWALEASVTPRACTTQASPLLFTLNCFTSSMNTWNTGIQQKWVNWRPARILLNKLYGGFPHQSLIKQNAKLIL